MNLHQVLSIIIPIIIVLALGNAIWTFRILIELRVLEKKFIKNPCDEFVYRMINCINKTLFVPNDLKAWNRYKRVFFTVKNSRNVSENSKEELRRVLQKKKVYV